MPSCPCLQSTRASTHNMKCDSVRCLEGRNLLPAISRFDTGVCLIYVCALTLDVARLMFLGAAGASFHYESFTPFMSGRCPGPVASEPTPLRHLPFSNNEGTESAERACTKRVHLQKLKNQPILKHTIQHTLFTQVAGTHYMGTQHQPWLPCWAMQLRRGQLRSLLP